MFVDILVEVNSTIETISLDVHSVGQSVGDVSTSDLDQRYFLLA